MYRDTLGNTYTTHSAIREERTDITFPRIITEEFLSLHGIKPVIPTPEVTVESKTEEIKTEAAKQIAALNWRMERAQERERLDEPGETLSEVLREREAIRRASNRIEQEITETGNFDEVMFEVTPEDWPPAKRLLSQYKFRQRFTLAEKAAIATARQSDSTLDAVLGDMDSALQLDLDSSELIQGLGYVEEQGLIAEGRASEILNG